MTLTDPVTTIELADEGVPALVGRLIDETRQLATAEIALYKARIGVKVSAYKSAAIFFVIAGVLALAALIAALVGAIMTLATTRLGPGWATVIVVVATLVIAAVLGMIGSGKLKPVDPA